MAESEDTEITDEKLTAVYSRAADARVTEEGRGGKGRGQRSGGEDGKSELGEGGEEDEDGGSLKRR